MKFCKEVAVGTYFRDLVDGDLGIVTAVNEDEIETVILHHLPYQHHHIPFPYTYSPRSVREGTLEFFTPEEFEPVWEERDD